MRILTRFLLLVSTLVLALALTSCETANDVTTDTIADAATGDVANDSSTETTPLPDGFGSDPGASDEANVPEVPAVADVPRPDGAEPDAPDVPDLPCVAPSSPHPFFDMAGRFEVRENVPTSAGTEPWGEVWGGFDDSAPADRYEVVLEGCTCSFYTHQAPAFCQTPCDPSTQYCSAESTCRPWPKRLDAGRIEVTGLSVPLSIDPDPGLGTWYHAVIQGKDLFEAGANVTIKAEGATLPAFSVDLSAPADLDVDLSGFDLSGAGDAIVTWKPTGDGARVELAMFTGLHGGAPMDVVWCEAPDESGRLVLPKNQILLFKLKSSVTFSDPPWIRRVSRKVFESGGMPYEVFLSSRRRL